MKILFVLVKTSFLTFETMAEAKLTAGNILTEQNFLHSKHLDREVIFDAYLPLNIAQPADMGLLLINDGQDLPKMHFDHILDGLIQSGQMEPLMCIGIHCGEDRKMEYGTVSEKDYKGRGAKAPAYSRFIFEELLPLVRKKYKLESFREKSFAGFSLGALTALDIVWNNPFEFSKAGLFSGSFWWRNKSYKEGYDDAVNRIMHNIIRDGKYAAWLKFFFECGALDETKDRNNNGIIDSIDDTLDLIDELKKKGFGDESIHYLELEDGHHDVYTWGRAFPDFLKWGWGKK